MTGLDVRVAAFVLPLLAGYGLALTVATGADPVAVAQIAWLFAGTAAPVAACLYVARRGVLHIVRREPLLCGNDARWMLLGILCIGLLFPSFGVFKQLLLPGRGFPYDPALATAERLLLGGLAPWQVTHVLFGNIWATLLLDRIYSFWSLIFCLFPLLIPIAARDSRLRGRMLIAWALTWLLVGTLAAFLLGSAGPCYYNVLIGPDANFALLNARLDLLARQGSQLGFELTNITFQQHLLQAFDSGQPAPAGGISAMPSMHVAMATLIALSGRAVSRGLGHVLAGYAVLIWIASVHLGWHYGLDGPVGALLTIGVWRLSALLIGPLETGQPVSGRLAPQLS